LANERFKSLFYVTVNCHLYIECATPCQRGQFEEKSEEEEYGWPEQMQMQTRLVSLAKSAQSSRT